MPTHFAPYRHTLTLPIHFLHFRLTLSTHSSIAPQCCPLNMSLLMHILYYCPPSLYQSIASIIVPPSPYTLTAFIIVTLPPYRSITSITTPLSRSTSIHCPHYHPTVSIPIHDQTGWSNYVSARLPACLRSWDLNPQVRNLIVSNQ